MERCSVVGIGASNGLSMIGLNLGTSRRDSRYQETSQYHMSTPQVNINYLSTISSFCNQCLITGNLFSKLAIYMKPEGIIYCPQNPIANGSDCYWFALTSYSCDMRRGDCFETGLCSDQSSKVTVSVAHWIRHL